MVRNNTQQYVNGELVFSSIPQEFEINRTNENVYIAPYETQTLEVFIKIKEGTKVINDSNLIKCEFIENGKPVEVYEFGLCGAPEVLVIGPYYDTYMDWLNKEDMPEKRLLKSGSEVVIIPEDSEEWGNHRVDIDKQYVCEQFDTLEKTRQLFAGGRKCSIIEDRYVLKEAFGFQGSACAYYYQEIICPEDREAAAFVGSSDPYKLWINGE